MYNREEMLMIVRESPADNDERLALSLGRGSRLSYGERSILRVTPEVTSSMRRKEIRASSFEQATILQNFSFLGKRSEE